MSKHIIVFILLVFAFLTAEGFGIDYIDSLRRLPPRLRNFGDAEYFETFIKPRQRDSLNVRCVGRWPFGPGFEVYGNAGSNILAFGAGSGVLIFDITDPANPVRLSQIAVNGLIMQVYIRDSFLFVASYGNGIEVFNLAVPSNPLKISQINVPARDFCLKDTFAYCVAEDSLRIINIADIFNPFQVGACKDSGYVVSISGNYVYTGGRWKLSAINVSNPANPIVVNFLSVWVYTLTCDGNHCYCVLNSGNFTIYNISNPLSIWQESQLNTVGGVDIFKLGFYVYLPGFVIVDVGDSANPFVVGDTILPVYAQAVWVNNNFGYGYVANDYVGLTPININNPTNPIALASIYGADDSRDVFVQGNYAYVSNLRKGLKIIDISTPANPFEAGEYDTTGILPNLESSWVRDTFAYVPTNALKILNIQNPNNPTLIGICPIAVGYASDICLRDSFAYLIEGRCFQSVKINNPATPESLPRYGLPDLGIAWSIFIKDSFAYITDGDSGLRILNISNPAIPFEVGHFLSSDAIYGIFVKDTIAYLTTLSTGLRVVNIKNPVNPQEIGYYIAPGWTRDIWVVDTVAYIAASDCVEVLSIANPVAPYRVGYYNSLPQSPRRIFYNAPYLFYSAFESGIGILEWYNTGISEKDNNAVIQNKISFELSPTVTNGKLNLIFYSNQNSCEVSLYDDLGRKFMILLKESIKKGRIQRNINVIDLPNGIYFIILKTKDEQLVKKLVVIH